MAKKPKLAQDTKQQKMVAQYTELRKELKLQCLEQITSRLFSDTLEKPLWINEETKRLYAQI